MAALGVDGVRQGVAIEAAYEPRAAGQGMAGPEHRRQPACGRQGQAAWGKRLRCSG